MKHILICNAGSSSLKFKIFIVQDSQYEVLTEGQFTRINSDKPQFVIKVDGQKHSKEFNTSLCMQQILEYLNLEINRYFPSLNIVCIGHRVVHGGEIYSKPTLVTPELIENLKSIIYLTPIHLPHNIAPMEICGSIFTGIPQVACFDTAFHSTIDEIRSTYAIPEKFTKEEKIRRYGFHGLSYEYLSCKLKEIDAVSASGKVVMAHLGAGASIAAVKNGQSVDTTMGLTPLEGLVMGTRCGSIDPSIVLHFMKKGLSYEDLTKILYFESGLLGISGLSADFVIISTSEDEKAKKAYDIFVSSVVKNILAMTGSLEGADAIVFSGGIGENSAKLRRDVLAKLSWLGVKINEDNNTANQEKISSEQSTIKAFVIPTQEELIIAKHAYELTNA